MSDLACTCANTGIGCTCGAVIDDTLQDGFSVRVGMMFADSALGRKGNTAMTNDQIRDGVRGMPLHKAKELSIYDGVRGAVVGGRPAEEYYAILDGAVPTVLGAASPTFDAIDAKAHEIAAHTASINNLNAWRNTKPVNDNKAKVLAQQEHARDGRPMSSLSDEERAFERSVHDLNGWRR